MVRLTGSTVILVGLIQGSRLVNAQFTIYDSSTLIDDSLGEDCRAALTATFDCSPVVQTFQELSYRGDLDVALTDSICTQDCLSSLKSWFDSVAVKCAGKSVSEGVPTRYGGYMWAGYNETCVKDPRPPRAYCNNVIANFTVVNSIEQTPRTELCHTCQARRLAVMQASQYSVYDESYKRQLEYIYTTCGTKGPIEIPPPLDKPEPVVAPYCLTNKRYTTKQGDTCQSISDSKSVSSAALYMGNQDLVKNCADVKPGVSICLPMTCLTYILQPTDTCFKVEKSLGLEYGLVQRYNSWLDIACTNLQSATDYYGKIICVSPQGGAFVNPTKPVVPNPTPVPADGHTKAKIPPPEGASVAEGTTMECGKWHVVVSGDLCVTICLANGIDTLLFHEVNPSLAAGDGCDTSLKEKTALCAGPTYQWKNPPPPAGTVIESGIPAASTVSVESGRPASSTISR
ncbi:hypothetical protein CC86DRAFT_360066 [Ophiobolus disseminans]|uniref:LysM domain-containing protein n=1 Tax=Ophiobolus disseminans TaxID=1469910 RepID=A0A6A6ZIF5_9PLEO|nr:hypothetical protein CC86DRAFT_360066 [Ophiobolus disseminans]